MTQLDLDGAAENDRDWLRGRLSEAERAAVTVPFRSGCAGPLAARFDMVLG